MKLLLLLLLLFFGDALLSETSSELITQQALSIFENVIKKDFKTNWDGKLTEPLKAIASIANQVGPLVISGGDIINFILSLKKDNIETQENLKNISIQLEKIDAKLDSITENIKTISLQIDSLSSKVSQSSSEISKDVKMQNYLRILGKINAMNNQFESIVSGYFSNTTSLVERLVKFIEEYKAREYEYELLETLDAENSASNSLINQMLSLYRQYQNDPLSSIRSSPIKIVYDIYLTTLSAVIKGNVIIESASKLKIAVTGMSFVEDEKYLLHKNNKDLQKFYKSLEKTLSNLNDNDLDGFNSLEVNGRTNEIRLTNVLQYFFEDEDSLSGSNKTCTETCEYYENLNYNNNGCSGSVKKCTHVTNSAYVLKQHPQIDRIYDGFSIKGSKWFGKGSEHDHRVEEKSSWSRGFVRCNICRCICDLFLHVRSIRRFYKNPITAKDGYVVTGVRFTEKNQIIFLQIQVGKLLPMGMIDIKSIQWQALPEDTNNYIEFNYDLHTLALSSIKFNHGILTGVQFIQQNSSIRLQLIAREIKNFNEGILGNEITSTGSNTSGEISMENKIPGLASSGVFSVSSNKKLIFNISSYEADAGQSFVPYIDGSEVLFSTPAPLGGLRLILYSNNENYAGYIRPSLASIDYRKLLSFNFSPKEFKAVN